jgi:hypothetical protein
MGHVITLGDVLKVGGGIIAIVVVLGLIVGVLSILGSAMKD